MPPDIRWEHRTETTYESRTAGGSLLLGGGVVPVVKNIRVLQYKDSNGEWWDVPSVKYESIGYSTEEVEQRNRQWSVFGKSMANAEEWSKDIRKKLQMADELDAHVKRIDVILNGETGAAKQARLIDILSQLEDLYAANNEPLIPLLEELASGRQHALFLAKIVPIIVGAMVQTEEGQAQLGGIFAEDPSLLLELVVLAKGM